MSKVNILVVEDESIVAKDLENRLKKLGYAVPATASSGEEAINKAAENHPDLVLMDINLKGSIDGVQAAQEIYNRFNIPVIYLTANADKKTFERAKTTEPLGYLIKPFKEKELHNTIEINLSRYRTEKKLKESEQWLATVLKSIGDAVIASDRTGAVTFINPIAEALTGWKQENALGLDTREIFNIIHEQTRTVIECPVRQALQKGITVSIPEQTILIAKNGAEIPIDDSAAPIKDDKGNITGAVLVFRDISEFKQAQEARQKQIEQERLVAQLQKLSQLKDDFLSTVSHELRTPIANMKMAIQMLKVAPTSERRERYLDILQVECARESELIDDLLDLQRLEIASYPIFIGEAVSLQNWLPSMIEPFRVRTQQRQQNLQLNLPPDLPPLISDRASLERILAELLNNACKYTPADGEIVLSVRHNSSSAAIARSSASATIFTISNSVEIPAAELPRIFEKFYRVPKADRWKQGGTGLGLALIQKLVEHLQGTIQVESSEGWTTFTVQLTNLVAATDQGKRGISESPLGMRGKMGETPAPTTP
jgi:PAS domain S-box-containing protein